MTGSYKLWEMAKSRDEVYELAEQVVEELGLQHLREDVKTSSVFNKSNWDEVSQSLLFALHHTLWVGPKHTLGNALLPFTHATDVKAPSMTDIVRKLVPQAEYSYCTHMASRATSILQGNQLIRVRGAGTNRHYWIREWPAGFQPRWVGQAEKVVLSQREQADILRQEQKAEELAGPVETSVDIGILTPPSADPDSVLEYIRKVIPLVKRLQAENADLKAQLSERTKDRWAGVASEIKDLLNE